MAKKLKERIITLMLVFASVNGICKEGQKSRIDNHGNKICCFPTICPESHQFILCSVDDGRDTCKACPSGQYTKDKIHTKEWSEQISICVNKPTCAEIDTTMINGECVCNKFIGYYGSDINNCHLDDQNCKESGYELDVDGCVQCPAEYFKPEDGSYGVCRPKTKCGRHQVEVHPGSSKKDRTCRKRTAKDPPPPTPPPTTDQTDHGTNSTKLDTGKDKLDMMYAWLIGVIVASVLIVVITSVLIYVFRKKWCCAMFLKMFKVGRYYAPVPPVENGSDRGHSTSRRSREEDHELTSITNIDSSLDSSKSGSNSSKEQEQTGAKYKITEVIVEMDENETGVKTLALEPKGGDETIVKSVSGDTNQGADLDSTSLKVRYDEKDSQKGQRSPDTETTVVKSTLDEMSMKDNEDCDISITKVKRNLSGSESITKIKKLADDKDMSITKVKRLHESESRNKKSSDGESKTPKNTHKGFLEKSKKGQSIDFNWPKFRKKTTQETSFSLPTTPKKSNVFGATSKESDRPTMKVEPFSRKSSPRNSQLECAGATGGIEESFETVPTGVSYPLFSDSVETAPTGMSYPLFSDSLGMSHPLYSDSTGFYSCDDDVVISEMSNPCHMPRRNNRATMPPDVFIIEGEMGNGKDSNGRVRSLPIISQEIQNEAGEGRASFWQQLALHGLESTESSQDVGHNITNPSVQQINAITHTSKSNEDVFYSTDQGKECVLVSEQIVQPEQQISIDPLSTLDANSIMNETQVSITSTNPLISIPRPHEVLPPPEPIFDETIIAGPSSSSSEEAISEAGASEGATSEGATSEGSAASILMPLLEKREENSNSTGSGSSRRRTLSRSLSLEEENKDSSSSTEKSMG